MDHVVSLHTSALRFAPGLLLSAGLAAAAMWLGAVPALANHGLSALTLAILFGIVCGHVLPERGHGVVATGIGFSKHWLLRTGIVLYGLRLTLQDIGAVGVAGVWLDVLVVMSTFVLACVLGVRWLKLDAVSAMLVGVGSAICGAAAVLAAAPVLRARAEQVTVAVATVVVFGTLSMLLYPLLHALDGFGRLIPGGEHGFAVYVGATVHEVAQVLAAARAISKSAADTAVISKMVRVMLLAPFLLGLAVCLRSWQAHSPEQDKPKFYIPWFAFGFIGVVVVNSFLTLPAGVTATLETIDTGILAMAMAALGISTRASAIRQAGIKPLLLALVLFVWLIVGGVGLLRMVS